MSEDAAITQECKVDICYGSYLQASRHKGDCKLKNS